MYRTNERLIHSSCLVCSSPTLAIVPEESDLLFPLQFRRDEDIYITSNIDLLCEQKREMKIQWTISNGLTSDAVNDSLLITTFNDLYIPVQFFSPGLYELKLTVTISVPSSLTSSKSAYVQIVPLDLLGNLLLLETSLITMGAQQQLPLDPGLYSLDLDGNSFNASVTISLSLSRR